MRCTTLVISAMITSATQVSAWPEYNPMIPNGDNVNGGTNIGHVDEAGVEGVNEFGAAFEEAGDAWTVELCQADSDGDGQTNGQELGDPCCEFVYETNAVVLWTEGVSHPSDSTSMSDPSLWESIDCSSSGTVTTAASNSTATDEEEEATEETSAEETSTEEMGSMAMSSEGTSTEETMAEESAQTSESTSGTTEGTTNSASGTSDGSTASTPASTSASTPAATNSAVQDRVFIVGATAAAFATAALW
jgi:hypothetical protein